MAKKPQVVSTAAAAEILSISTATVRRMVKAGDLLGFLRQGMGRITVRSIEKLLGEPIAWEDDEAEEVAEEQRVTFNPPPLNPEEIRKILSPPDPPEGDTP